MFIKSFILCIVATMMICHKMFYNKKYYKQVSDKQQKVLYISNIITFRNSLFDYCDSLDLTDLKYEIENNDLIYIDRLLQIKNKIDNYYKQINDSSDDLSDDLTDESTDEPTDEFTDDLTDESSDDLSDDSTVNVVDDETDVIADGNIADVEPDAGVCGNIADDETDENITK